MTRDHAPHITEQSHITPANSQRCLAVRSTSRRLARCRGRRRPPPQSQCQGGTRRPSPCLGGGGRELSVGQIGILATTKRSVATHSTHHPSVNAHPLHSFHPFIHLFIHHIRPFHSLHPIHQSTQSSINPFHLFIHPSIHPFIHPSIHSLHLTWVQVLRINLVPIVSAIGCMPPTPVNPARRGAVVRR